MPPGLADVLFLVVIRGELSASVVVRAFRVSHGIRNALIRDGEVIAYLARAARHAVAPGIAVVENILATARTDAQEGRSCIECWMHTGREEVCEKWIDEAHVGTFSVCDTCRRSGYRKLVNMDQLRRLAYALKWKPRNMSVVKRGLSCHLHRPHARSNKELFFVCDMVAYLRARPVDLTAADERHIEIFER